MKWAKLLVLLFSMMGGYPYQPCKWSRIPG